MNSTTRRRSRLAATSTGALVMVLALAGCGTQRAGSGSEDLPVLRIGSVSASARSGAPDLASGASNSPGTDSFTVRGTLPTGPGSAAVHHYGDGRAEESAVRTLAVAFGIAAVPTRHDYGWEVTDSAGVLHVRDGSGLEWTFSRSLEECATYLVDIDHAGSGGSAISSCTRAVAADSPGVVATPSAGSGSGSGGSDPTPVDPTPAPAPTKPAPSSDAALTAAEPILAALGIAAEPRVLPAWSSWRTVMVDPTVAGLPTVGIATTIDVDTTGVIGAMGRLESPTAGPEYPILTAAAALERLNSAPRPLPAIACPETKDGPSACPGVDLRPAVITGATLGLTLSFDGADPILVPAWLYTVDGWTDLMPAIAVEDRYLGEPTPGPDPSTGSGGGSSNPGSAGSEPDGPVATPIPPVEPAPGASGPTSPQSESAVTAVAVAADGRTLYLTGWGGVCATYAGRAIESSTKVRVSIVATPTIGPDQACIELAKEIEGEVRLRSALGDRSVVDAATGITLKVSTR